MIAQALSALMPFAASIENPSTPLTDESAWGRFAWGGEKSAAGTSVSHGNAITLASVWQALSIISGDVATATLNLHKKNADDNREIDRSNPVQTLISADPNGEIPAFELWRRAMIHALLFGNGYIHVHREGRSGAPLWLGNLLPDRTSPDRDENGDLFYWSEIGGKKVPFQTREIIHIRGIGLSGDSASDLVMNARETIGLAMAAQEFNAKFFGNGAQAGGLLEVPMGMSPKAVGNLEEGFRKKYTGSDNWFKTIVLRDGAKFHQLTVDAERSQLHTVREDQVRDVARFFNLPSFKLGLSDSVSYNSAEQAQIVYLSGTLRHWMSAITSECRIKLLTPQQIKTGSHYFEHNVSKLLEADTKTLTEVLVLQRSAEIINANEARRKLNMNPRTDPGGDEYVNPSTRSANSQQQPAQTDGAKTALRGLLVENLTWAANRVCRAAKTATRDTRSYAEFLTSGLYAQRATIEARLAVIAPVIAIHTGGDADGIVYSIAGRFFNAAQTAFSPWVEPPHGHKDLKHNVEQASSDFTSAIAETIADHILKEKRSEKCRD